MPELPEVETVRRGLAEYVVGRTVARAEFRGARVTRRHALGPDDLAARLAGARVASAQRRGKYLWLVMEPPVAATGGRGGLPGGAPDAGSASPAPKELTAPKATSPRATFALVVHLGMSGQLLVESSDAPAQPHLRATLDFADPPTGPRSRRTHLRFVDQRTFGGVALADLVAAPGRPDGVPQTIAHIAPDPLEPAYDQSAVVAAMQRGQRAVKRALLDQRLVSGIGNIYADEALWLAKVHGERPCPALSRPALGRVLTAAREVMERSLDAGGTSFDALYVNVNGASGYFDRSLSAYGQAGRPCARCGAPIRREPFMNRSSYSCPRCQPRPRTSAPTSVRTSVPRSASANSRDVPPPGHSWG